MLFGLKNEPPGARFRVGLAALTLAVYFRDDEHRDVLLQSNSKIATPTIGGERHCLLAQETPKTHDSQETR